MIWSMIVEGRYMTHKELVEKVEAEIIAMKLEAGDQKVGGHLLMSEETLRLLLGSGVATYVYPTWRSMPIYTRKHMAFGEVEGVVTQLFQELRYRGSKISVDSHTYRGRLYGLSAKLTNLKGT